MPERTVSSQRKARLPGLDADANPVIGLGLGVTGLMLRIRPRLAPVSLALTAAAALLYRDPERSTPAESASLFAPADGSVNAIEELYEHRFLHTDAVRLSIAVAPFDVPVHRSPAAGVIAYLEHVPGVARPSWDLRTAEQNERQYIGIHTSWGPLLLSITAGPLARRVDTSVRLGTYVPAGA
ncbi:MAG TPA: phosphatidylserine decarboxylase, partial [Roseiflexaceae bacterium]|nr:phosphatidylserine decarboxylase [Roseiflexaceae bacterium]